MNLIDNQNLNATILEIQRMSTEDGPGIRTTIFFKGCSLKCAWCHNPESISPHPQIHWIANQCIGCETCLAVCPEKALSLSEEGNQIDRDLCTGCGNCWSACPDNAIGVAASMVRNDITRKIAEDLDNFQAHTFNGGAE